MNIGILGTGRMASALATAWARAGHTVTLGSRSPEAARRDLPAAVRLATQAQAAARDVVVLATPFRVTADVVATHAAALAGKTIVDITNPFGAAPAGTAGVEVHRRALERAAAQVGSPAQPAPRPARWAAAFKTNFARTVGVPADPPHQCFIAADCPEARGVAERLARDAALQPVDCGDLGAALALDLMVPLMIDLDGRLAGGSGCSTWRFVPGRAG